MANYAGKISNKSVQEVKAVYPQSGAKAPKKETGGDLRAKKGGK